MNLLIGFVLLFSPFVLAAFESKPWFPPIAELELKLNYSYEHYPSVSHAFDPPHDSSKDHLIDLNLEVSFLPKWEAQVELDLAKTSKLSLGTRRVGLEVRYLFLDDVAGDPVSFTTDLLLFYVPTRNMKDVSSPYHAQGNFELGMAVGKEIDLEYDWAYRFFGFLGLGQANRGYPWVRSELSFQRNYKNRHHFSLFTEGYFGLGPQKKVIVDHFNGYAKIQHQSVDLGINYTYLFDIWGSFTFQYAYRVYALSFPRKLSSFSIEYKLPFSIL